MSRKRIRTVLCVFVREIERREDGGGTSVWRGSKNNESSDVIRCREIAGPHMYIAIHLGTVVHSAGDRGFTDSLNDWRASSSPQRLGNPSTRQHSALR